MAAKYQSPFVSKVIARLDFNPPYKKFNSEIDKRLLDKIREYFPILLPQQNIATELKISAIGGHVETTNTARQELHFHSNDRQQRLVLNENFLLFDLVKYDGFKRLQNTFSNIVNVLFDTYEGLNVNRFGLRYINSISRQIEGQYDNIFQWDDYINKTLTNLTNFIEDKHNLIRAINIAEMKYDDYSVRFQYGFPNPDYPANIAKKSFLLDYDAYCNWILTKDDIIRYLPIFHDKIQELFEKSITDEARNKMVKIDE